MPGDPETESSQPPMTRPQVNEAALPEGTHQLSLELQCERVRIELRCLAVVVLVGTLALGAHATADMTDLVVFGAYVPTGCLAAIVGLVGWSAIYLLDRHWYHSYAPAVPMTGKAGWLTTFFPAGAVVLIAAAAIFAFAETRPMYPPAFPPTAVPAPVPCPPPVGESPIPAAPGTTKERLR